MTRGKVAWSRRLPCDRRGGVAILIALLLPLLVAVLGLVIDVGMAYAEKNALQTSAEAAALAAAGHIASADRIAALATAQTYAGHNRPGVTNLVSARELEFGNWDAGSFTPGGTINAVRVTASRTAAKNNALHTFFAGMFGLSSWDLSATAIATAPNPLCILILHPTHGDAFDVDPGAQIDAPDCTVQVNSRNRGALELGDSSYVNVKSIRVVGGVDKSAGASVSPAPVTGAVAIADPYAAIAPPTNTNCGGADRIKGGTVIITATFAFCRGLVIDDATVTFLPGIYVIKGEFTLLNGAAINGTDVLIYLEGAGHDLFFHRKTSFDLKGPTTGPYAGMVIWSDRANTNDHDIYSKLGASASGTIYMPSSQLEIENNVEWEADCIRIVAARLELDNNSKYKSTKPGRSCTNNLGMAKAKLVR